MEVDYYSKKLKLCSMITTLQYYVVVSDLLTINRKPCTRLLHMVRVLKVFQYDIILVWLYYRASCWVVQFKNNIQPTCILYCICLCIVVTLQYKCAVKPLCITTDTWQAYHFHIVTVVGLKYTLIVTRLPLYIIQSDHYAQFSLCSL